MEHGLKLRLGVCISLVAALFYALYSAVSKVLTEQGATFSEVVFFVFFIGWLCLIPYGLKKGISHLKSPMIQYHILRAVFGLSFMYAFVFSLKLIPLVEAVMLNNTAPLFVPFIVHYWLGTKLDHKIWFALILGLAGVALILKPSGIVNIGSLVALASGMIMAFSWSSVRKLSMSEPVYRIIFYYFFFAAAITFFPFIAEHASLPAERLFGLICAGVLFLLSTMLLTYATTLISIVPVSILFYSVILFSGLLNWAIWKQVPDWMTLVGMLLIIAGGAFSILIEKRRSKKEILD